MFKEKSFGAAPPFLQLDDSESETEKEPTVHEQNSVDATPVEPNVETFDDTKVVNNSESVKSEIKSEPSGTVKAEKSNFDDASDISSDDELLLKASGSPKTKRTKTNVAGGGGGDDNGDGNDDRMSLSSLSSNEDKAKVKKVKIEADAATTANSTMPPLPNSNDYYYGAAAGSHPSYYPNGAAYDPYTNQYMPHGYMQQYVAGLSALIPGSYNMPADSLEPSTSHDAKKDANEAKVSAVIDRVIAELKQILKKDSNKRMIEIIAYKQFDTWWDEQARRDKNKSNTTTEVTVKKTPVKVPDINQVINSRENSYNGLGLGFRTQILKLPRFQRIRKPPSPVKDEDSKKGLSDQEDIIQDSDSEVVLDAPKSTSTFNEKLKENESKLDRKRKAGSVSSFFTSSDEENSSSAESDSELDTSSLSDMDDFESKIRIQHYFVCDFIVLSTKNVFFFQFPGELVSAPKTKNIVKKIYSDSDSDDEIKPAIVPSKSKLRLYSDTVSEEEAEDDDDDELDDIKSVAAKPRVKNVPSDEPLKIPVTPGRDTSPFDSKQPKSYDYDRVYSDSEEEREYQEKRRRNTEYMEQIEREFMEEQLKQKQDSVAGETTEDDVPEKAPSPGDPSLSASQLPPTPDVRFDPPDEPLSKKSLAAARKAKAAIKKNGLMSISEASEDDTHKGKVSPRSTTSQESQTSQMSQVQLEHCYSLPPIASPLYTAISESKHFGTMSVSNSFSNCDSNLAFPFLQKKSKQQQPTTMATQWQVDRYQNRSPKARVDHAKSQHNSKSPPRAKRFYPRPKVIRWDRRKADANQSAHSFRKTNIQSVMHANRPCYCTNSLPVALTKRTLNTCAVAMSFCCATIKIVIG